ncbi:hypothetical protein [uncultured Polaribacter sp.]|uniref:hypothetical protein n=1 Tax=uncultured Polaribacter sp. TaxID=174711 RepID=UPI00263081E3|nr:hypothetical protein [uncultured Polaribacter sp.]
MTLIAILNFFSNVFGFTITILGGILLIRHRQCIAYFKSSFTFIKQDYEPEIVEDYDNIFKEALKAIKYGFSTLKKSNSKQRYFSNQSNEINQIIVLIGKLVVFSGILGIITTFISSIWMIFKM